MTRPFIRSYNTAAEEYEKIKKPEDGEARIREDWNLLVTANIERGGAVYLSSVRGINEITGEGRVTTPCKNEVLELMEEEIKAELLKRKYAWDEFDNSIVKLPGMEKNSDDKTIFLLRSNKECRDAFWWPSLTAQLVLPVGFGLRFNDWLGAEVGIGNEEYGALWGEHQQMRIGAVLQSVKIYTLIPVKGLGTSFIGGTGAPSSGIGGGFSFDEYNFGGGFMFQERDWSFTPGTLDGTTSHTIIPRAAGFGYFSMTHDVQRFWKDFFSEDDTGQVLPRITLRWKLGFSLRMTEEGVYSSILTDISNPERTLAPAFYGRIEIVGGRTSSGVLNSWEGSLQTIIGTEKSILLTGAYNFLDYIGFGIKMSMHFPEKPWTNSFNLLPVLIIRF